MRGLRQSGSQQAQWSEAESRPPACVVVCWGETKGAHRKVWLLENTWNLDTDEYFSFYHAFMRNWEAVDGPCLHPATQTRVCHGQRPVIFERNGVSTIFEIGFPGAQDVNCLTYTWAIKRARTDTNQGTSYWLSNIVKCWAMAFRQGHPKLLLESWFWLSRASCGARVPGSQEGMHLCWCSNFEAAVLP